MNAFHKNRTLRERNTFIRINGAKIDMIRREEITELDVGQGRSAFPARPKIIGRQHIRFKASQ